MAQASKLPTHLSTAQAHSRALKLWSDRQLCRGFTWTGQLSRRPWDV